MIAWLMAWGLIQLKANDVKTWVFLFVGIEVFVYLY